MGQTVTTGTDRQDITIATWLDEDDKGNSQDGTHLNIDNTADEEEVTILSFTVGDLSTLGISATHAILRKVYIVLTRRSTPSGSNTAQMCFLTSDFTENQAQWYGPHDESSTTEAWEPAFDGNSTSVSPTMLKGQVIDSQTSSGAGAITFTIDEDLINKHKITFGSTVNVGIWSTSGEADFDQDGTGNTPQYYITYEVPTPEPPEISMVANPDGVTGTINVDKLSGSPSMNKYSLCWSATDSTPDNGDTVTDFADTGIKKIHTDQLSGSPLATEATTYYFKLFAEDGVNNDDNGGGSNIIKIVRPDVASSGTAISPSSLTVGQETTLTVVATDLSGSGHPYGGKFSSVLVNWDSVASDTAADYVEYKFADNTAPALTTASNLTITHKYHKPPDMTASANFSVKVKIRDPDGWISDSYTVGNATVAASNPIAHINSNKGKVMNAKFADKNNMLTISAAQSRAIGSTREIENYLFTCIPGRADTIATMGAYDNDNEVFDSGSKRVALRTLADGAVGGTRLKIYGLASFDADGDPTPDLSAGASEDFAYYKYVSETLKPSEGFSGGDVFVQGTTAGAAGVVGNYSYNFFKSVDAAVFTTVDAQDASGDRYLLTAYTGDITTRTSGVLLTEAIDINSERMLNVDTVEPFRVGDVIKIDAEYMKVLHRDDTNSRLYVCRGYQGAGSSTHSYGYMLNHTAGNYTEEFEDDDEIFIVDPWIINRDLRYRTKTTTNQIEERYRWGGFAQLDADSSLADSGMYFTAFDGSGDGVGLTARPLSSSVIAPGAGSYGSSVNQPCFFRNGFFEDDIIEVTGTPNNGSATSPKFYKIASIRNSANVGPALNDGDELTIYGGDVDDYLTTDFTTEQKDALIRRVVTNPTRSVALYNPQYTDEVVFETLVYDNTGSTPLKNDTATTVVTLAQPNVLDLLTATDYDSLSTANRLTSSDIAILNIDKSRDGGLAASMPLGGDKYPVSVIRNKIGLPTLSAQLRVISSTGLRKIRSLIEGDTYDYVFIDSSQVDTPGVVDVTYRMKMVSGTLTKSPELANDYLANLEFVIVGEDVS